MNYRAILLCSFLLASAAALSAQERGEPIDLDVLSGSAVSGLSTARVSFVEGDRLCHEERGKLRISGGSLTLYREPASPIEKQLVPSSRVTNVPVDDDSYDYSLQMSDCRMDIAVRQQVHRDGSWTSLLIQWTSLGRLTFQERTIASWGKRMAAGRCRRVRHSLG
jgi:hypothetical protein